MDTEFHLGGGNHEDWAINLNEGNKWYQGQENICTLVFLKGGSIILEVDRST